METIKTLQNDIEAFLYDEINIEILEYLISLKYTGRLEPLEYFNLLFSEFDFFIKNSSDYLKITERFVFPTIDDLDMFEIKAVNNSIIYAGLTKLISKFEIILSGIASSPKISLIILFLVWDKFK